jgi:two-component system, LytTR family, response regulator
MPQAFVLRTLLIDDEPAARRDLRQLLAAHPEVSVVGEAATLDAGRELLTRETYDLVFLDVQLLGGTGFDLVPHVATHARVVFVSAFDKFALRAFEVNALDYLQKPVRTARLAESLRRAADVRPEPAGSESAAPVLRDDDLVHVKTGPGRARFLRVAEIVAIASQDNYTELNLTNGERLLVRQTLAAWEQRLPATHFLRVHRQTIANLQFIRGYTHEDEEVSLLHVEFLQEPVRARRHLWPELLARLDALGVKPAVR